MLLNPDQQLAVEEEGNCLVVACPGAGKTTMSVEKIAYILDKVPSSRVVAVTFTKEGAEEIARRIKKKYPDAEKRIASGTFHGLSYKMLRGAKRIATTILAEAEQMTYAARATKLAGLALPPDEAARIIEHIKTNTMVSQNEIPDQDAEKLVAAYTELLQRNHAMDFQDLVREAATGMRDGTLKPIPCTHLIVDEYQDTDALQYEWIKAYQKCTNAVVTVVADDDQSIFGWRHAMGYGGMERFREEFNARVITLAMNYRCHSEILDPAAKLITFNVPRMPKSLLASKGTGGNVEKKLFDTPNEEAFTIAETVKESPHDWAILTRNNYRLDTIEAFLTSASVPYKRLGGKKLWDRAGARLVMALLRAADGSGKPAQIDHILRFAGMSENSLTKLHGKFGGSLDLSSQAELKRPAGTELGVPPEEFSLYRDFVGYLIGWRTACNEARHSLALVGIGSWIEEVAAKKKRELEQAKKALMVIGKLTGSFAERLRFVETRKKDETPGVTISTLHGSKGLEWPCVWIAGMEQGVLPDSDSVLTEERRLAYVGMTRAKKTLVLSASCLRPESEFLREAGLSAIPGETN